MHYKEVSADSIFRQVHYTVIKLNNGIDLNQLFSFINAQITKQ